MSCCGCVRGPQLSYNPMKIITIRGAMAKMFETVRSGARWRRVSAGGGSAGRRWLVAGRIWTPPWGEARRRARGTPDDCGTAMGGTGRGRRLRRARCRRMRGRASRRRQPVVEIDASFVFHRYVPTLVFVVRAQQRDHDRGGGSSVELDGGHHTTHVKLPMDSMACEPGEPRGRRFPRWWFCLGGSGLGPIFLAARQQVAAPRRLLDGERVPVAPVAVPTWRRWSSLPPSNSRGGSRPAPLRRARP